MKVEFCRLYCFLFDYLPRCPEEVWKLPVHCHIAYTPTKINKMTTLQY